MVTDARLGILPEYVDGEEAAAEHEKSGATSKREAPIAVLRVRMSGLRGVCLSLLPPQVTTTAVRSSPSSSSSASFIDQMLSLARTVALYAHAVCFVGDSP